MIQTKNIEFKYDDRVFLKYPDISCTVEKPLLITGKSGCGKSTLLHILAGLTPNFKGEVWIRQTGIHLLPPKKLDAFRGKHIGIVFQKPHFIASISVLENIELAAFFGSGIRKTKQAIELMQQLSIDHLAKKLPQAVSVGELQRVAIARALMNLPQLIIADEPTSSLDDVHANIVANLLAEQANKANAALIIVTHDERLKTIFNNHIQLQ